MIRSSNKPNVMIAVPVLLMGGTEFQTLSLVHVLVGAEYRLVVCCYYEFDESVVKLFKEAGSEIILLRMNRSDDRFGPLQIFKLAIELITTIREYCPDIVNVQYLAPGLIPIIASRLSGVRTLFATVHQPSRPYGLKEKLFLRLGACLCTAFFCVSKSAEKSWFGNSEILNPQNVNRNRKHFTIYNAVDVSAITHAVASANLDHLRMTLGLDGCHVGGIVGRLRKEKGHSILLEAMAEVVKDIPDAKLLVVGDGPDKIQLIERSKKLGIDDHVLWLGLKKPKEVFQLYGIMDVVVVPSLFEGFGLTAAEAMAAGLPVVASDVDGLSEVIENGQTGHLVPVGDSNTMAKRLVELLSNPSKAQAMGEAGRQRVKQLFSMERFTEAILAAYRYFPSH